MRQPGMPSESKWELKEASLGLQACISPYLTNPLTV